MNKEAFLKDREGNFSIKRLGFWRSLNHWISMGWITLGYLLAKGKYDLAVNLVEAAALTTFGFAGVIVSEFFAKIKTKIEDNKNVD